MKTGKGCDELRLHLPQQAGGTQNAAEMSHQQEEIDESLYSRQLYVMGHEAQRKMAASSVLIVGLNGLGVEVAKNVILAGVKSVALYDSKVASYVDLSAQFYLSEADIGANRAAVSAPKLAELNPHVAVSVLDHLDLNSLQSNYKVVVLIDLPGPRRAEIADHCHANGVYVVAGDTFGVFGSIFCDFGPEFVVHDVDGEQAFTSMIAGITSDAKALVTTLEETRHNLVTGDYVTLTEITGMTELNGQQFQVEVKDPYSFIIDVDTTNFTPYARGGYVTQVKMPTTISFKSYSESLRSPGEFICDFSKIHRAAQLHLAFRGLETFELTHGVLPEPGNITHANEVVALTSAYNANIPLDGGFLRLSDQELQDEERLIQRLALCARGQVSPICALLGGIMGQEVLKACSGKFMPIRQWFYYDAVEALHDDPLPVDEVAPRGTRYDGQIMVFGRTIQERLSSLNMFLVGAGAIGCEMIKNWAMMGIASGSTPAGTSGTVYVTDMDQIEKSNLSRQFLFRNTDINCPKSTTAVRAVTAMNPSFHAIAFESKVAPDTEAQFNDDFFEGLDMVCTALDNVEARLYIDQKCLFYRKPMLESGTLGAKGHTQIIAPGKTENYGATRDPPEKSIPVCTLKHFPNQIDHTLQWARDWFEEEYSMAAKDTIQYLTTPDYATNSALAAQQNMRIETLSRIQRTLVTERPRAMEDCVAWARRCFEDLFSNRIRQLLHNFPLDRLTATGTPFWSGAKKPPTPIDFNPADPLHAEFIYSAACLRASMYGVPTASCPDPQAAAALAANVTVERFRPKEGVKIAATDEEAKSEAAQPPVADVDAQAQAILDALPAAAQVPDFRVNSIEFDKDIDAQMRVVAAVSNLRARNYAIPEADLHTSRGIAGKITPAIATTTAMVTAAICVELYKLLLDKPVEQLRNTFSNLALPLFTSAEPDPPKATKVKVQGKDWVWTAWDRIDVTDPELTVTGLMAMLEEDYGVELSMLSSGVTILYSDFMDRKKMQERKAMTLPKLVEAVTKKAIPATQKYLILELIVNDIDSGDEVEIPYLRFKLY